MSSLKHQKSAPPFPTRYPAPPRLALARRRPARSHPAISTESDRGELASSAAPAAEQLARQLELSLALRERAVTEAEVRLAELTRDLDERAALLRAREALLAAERLRDPAKRSTLVTHREADALHRLRDELERQEINLDESRRALAEREKFLEQSETQLLAKLQQQQERETELEQREETLAARAARLDSAAAPRPYDEFRE